MLNYAVVAHTSRQPQADNLALKIGATTFTDNGNLGCEQNHRRAWQHLNNQTGTYGVALEDDALPVDDFNQQAQAALAAAPTPIVSFYLGKQRPPHWQNAIRNATKQADLTDANWIINTHLLHAVAVAIRTDLIDDMLDYTAHERRPQDYAIGAWALTVGIPIAYTWPSLVDHQDGPTIIKHPDGKTRPPGRVAWKTGTRTTWNNTTVRMNP